jgi:hypothetical protein
VSEFVADNDDQGTIHGTSEGGIAGKHATGGAPELRVGATTADQFNTITLRLVPIACFRVDDIRFAFGSSFVTSDPDNDKNDIRTELQLLVDLLEANPQSPLCVFGHADPVGDDNSNKQLSGRRATVIYALLISTTDPDSAVKLWQDVAKTEKWGAGERQQMQTLTGLPDGTSDTDLFKAYMQKLAPATLKIAKKDFLAQGKDPKGKGDYQGCSEFNPQLIFSKEKNDAFEKDADKTARNDANSINRRVIVLLFQKGSKVEPANWPCPRATEGVGGCRARFFSDGDTRRSRRLPKDDRKFDDKQDTFACRFYQKLLTDSPCETAMTLVKIRLFDAQARPLPFAPCIISESGQKPRAARATGAPPSPLGTTAGSPPGTVSGGNKEEGIVTLRVQNLPATANIRWSRPKATESAAAALPNPADLDDFEFQMNVTIEVPDTDPNAAARIHLKNLGYDTNPPKAVPGLGNPIQAFQRDYKPQFADIVVDGTLNQPTIDDSKTAHDGNNPVLRAGSDIPLKR